MVGLAGAETRLDLRLKGVRPQDDEIGAIDLTVEAPLNMLTSNPAEPRIRKPGPILSGGFRSRPIELRGCTMQN
jgi:hypothetical protein